ncbi:c-type cytochrome [Methylomonas sp. MgM2]
MKHSIYKTGICILFFTLTTPLHAADINAGKSKSAVCLGCHGSEGVSKSPIWPNLAAQSRTYIEIQLKKFKTGERSNSSMNAIAKDLSDADIQNLAAYFASLAGKSAGGDATLAAKGQQKTAMCVGCHGEDLKGVGQFPRLAGQHPDYLSKQLHNFKSGERKGGPMNGIAQGLSEEDIDAIAAYLGSL